MTSSGSLDDKAARPDREAGELPSEYGETEAALLPRDPHWMFIYWEITPASLERVALQHGPEVHERFRQTLRVYEAPVNGGTPRYFDIPVMFEAKSWYVCVSEPGRPYYCELGLASPDGSFIGIVKTNTATLPPGRVSDKLDGNWLSVADDFDRLLQLSGVEYIGKGSGEVAKSLAQRWEMLQAVFSRGASWGISSLSPVARAAEKKFWLVADCELVLYGATEPGAFVTVCGRKVNLNPDGTFSMRFALPDGETGLPVRAMSPDETQSRQVEIQVKRTTLQRDVRAGA